MSDVHNPTLQLNLRSKNLDLICQTQTDGKKILKKQRVLEYEVVLIDYVETVRIKAYDKEHHKEITYTLKQNNSWRADPGYNVKLYLLKPVNLREILDDQEELGF